jgi:hypothetical protein
MKQAFTRDKNPFSKTNFSVTNLALKKGLRNKPFLSSVKLVFFTAKRPDTADSKNGF